jgi:hypothetical protein
MFGYRPVLAGVTLRLMSVSRERGNAISGQRLQRNSFLPVEKLASKEGVSSVGISVNRTFVNLHLFVLSAVLLKTLVYFVFYAFLCALVQ